MCAFMLYTCVWFTFRRKLLITQKINAKLKKNYYQGITSKEMLEFCACVFKSHTLFNEYKGKVNKSINLTLTNFPVK